MIKPIQTHGPVLLALVAVVFLAFGRLTTTPLWNSLDMQIICDAHVLSLDPSTMFNHIGFYFSQPLLQLAFLGEYMLFGLNGTGYIATNLLVHTLNAFLVYMLVNMLFPRKNLSVIAALLFALSVGSYGRVFTTLHQLEGLMLATFHILVLYVFIRNDFRYEGKIRSWLFLLGLALFLLTGLTKASSFSLVGCLFAYKVFFYRHRNNRSVLSLDLIVFIGVSLLFYVGRHKWGYQNPTIFETSGSESHFSLLSIKNIFRYLALMFFPLQQSPILATAPFWIVWVYHARVVIRFALTLSILSYSFFGVVFGSRAIRFFIAWTYITLLPFTGHTDSGQWLNLSHLYLTSLGFCVILAAGATGCSALIKGQKWRQYTPYLVPAYFAVISVGVAWQLDGRNKGIAATDDSALARAEMVKSCQTRPIRIQDKP
ncbi:MAG: hypothetical protein ACI9UK_001275 [Candidatus Krumholzibacteriia bacterium]|jgi:hypothetical protein